MWGKGYASEAARAWLAQGFGRGIPEVIAFTTTANLPSRRVMERIGMQRAADLDFEHPRVTEGNPLRSMLVWRIRAG